MPRELSDGTGMTVEPDGVRVVNLTPHRVVVRTEWGDRVFESEGVARVTDVDQPIGELADSPLVEVSVGDVTGLPGPRPGTVYLVSRVLASTLPERSDLVFPFGEIRDEAGGIVAVSALARFSGADRLSGSGR